MGTQSHIEYLDGGSSGNPITGCTPISPACDHCYAKREFAHYHPNRDFADIRLHPERLEIPRHWRRGRIVFVCTVSDILHPRVPAAFILEIFKVMAACPQHTFLVLTKRPERYAGLLYGAEGSRFLRPGAFLPNVRLGTTAETQTMADRRISALLGCGWRGTTWVSIEPMLERVNIRPYLAHPFTRDHQGSWCTHCIPTTPGTNQENASVPETHGPFLDWVAAGGESGPKARGTIPDHVRDLRDQCIAAQTPFYFKQWGNAAHRSILPGDLFADLDAAHNLGNCTIEWFYIQSKRRVGRQLDGREWSEQPVNRSELPFAELTPKL